MRDARRARQELQDMADAARAYSAAEVSGATAAASARRSEINALSEQARSLTQLSDAAKRTNQQLYFGGRNDMAQHLTDLSQELQYRTLLNRAEWMGFSTVQQAMAYRQQMYNQKLLENRAEFAGYQSADQYLGFLQRQTASYNAQAAAIRSRSAAVQDSTGAFLALDNAVQGSHSSIGQLGEGLSAVSAFSDALTGLPDTVTTRLAVDDAGALSAIAAYKAALGSVPAIENTRFMSAAQMLGGLSPREPAMAAAGLPRTVSAAAEAAMARAERATLSGGGGGEPPGGAGGGGGRGPGTEVMLRYFGQLEKIPPKVVTQAEFDDAGASEELHAWVGDLVSAIRDRYVFYAQLDDEEALARLQRFVGQVKAAGATGVPGTERLTPVAEGGAAGGGVPPPGERRVFAPPYVPPGGGGGVPPRPPGPAAAGPPEEPDPDRVRAAADALRAMSSAEREAAAGGRLTADEWLRMAAAASTATRAAAYVRAAALANRMAMADAAAAARETARVIPPMVDGLVASAGGWFGLNSQLRLFGGLMPGVLGHVAAWHVLVDFIIEGLAVFIPALVTLAADLTAFGVAGYDAGKAVYDRIVAIHTASDALQQTLAPMTGQLEKLHAQVRPMVWQLYGDAIDIAHSKTGLFNQLAVLTGTTLDRLAARVTVFATSASKGLETFFRIGNADLAQLGTFFSNLGAALLTFIRVTQQTHVDQIFLSVFVALSQLLRLVTELPTPLLAAAVGLHAAWLWGGLLATVLMQVLGPVRAVAVALGGLAAEETALARAGEEASAFTRLRAGLSDIAAGAAAAWARLRDFIGLAPAATAAEGEIAAGAEGEAGAMTAATAAAGGFRAVLATLATAAVFTALAALAALVAFAGYKIATAKDAAQQWIDSMNRGLARSSAFQVIGKTMGDLAAVTEQLTRAQDLNSASARELSGMRDELSARLGLELDHVGQVAHAYGVSMPMALALLNTAGVKTSDLFTAQGQVWAADLQQVRGLVDGYKAMGQGMSEIQRDVSVQLVMGSDQVKSMQALNQQWDAFQKLVAEPYTGIIKVATDLRGMATAAGAAGASMTGLSANSLTLQRDFQGTYTDVETLFSAIRSADAVTGAAGFSGAVRHAVQALIPLAGNNKAAAAEISQLAQEAGGPATTSLQALARWAGHTHDPLAALYADSQKATIGASNLDQDAARLTQTLQADLNPALASAAFSAMGGQKALNTFATDLAKLGPDSQVTIGAGRQVAQMFLSIDKNSASAKAQFTGWLESMGMSRGAAERLWAEVSKGARPLESVRQGLASSATASDNLAKSGFFAGLRDRFTTNMHEMARWFTETLPNAIQGLGHWWTREWSRGYEQFMSDLGSPLHRFWMITLPGWFNDTVPAAAARAWRAVSANFMTNFGSPVASFVTRSIPGFFTGIGAAVGRDFGRWWDSFHGNFVVLVGHVFENLIPGWMNPLGPAFSRLASGMGKSFTGQASDPISRFFTSSFPAFMAGSARDFAATTVSMWHGFYNHVQVPLHDLFNREMPAWFSAVASFFAGSWARSWAWFSRTIIGGWSNLWLRTFPAWLTNTENFFTGSWSKSWSFFTRTIVGGFSHFFGSTMPGWISGMQHGFISAWDRVWSSFEGAGRNAVNWVIEHVINHGVIDLINEITGVFHIPKIGYVRQVAAGGEIAMAAGGFTPMSSGSVYGTGETDGTPILAMGGEWMLRKPARMALQASFGPDFLPFLNQADSWLGSGSRGTAASQRSRSAAAPFPAAAPRYASGGQIVAEAERFIGAPYVYGGASPSGWDCSGFVQWVLEALGWHNVPRTSEAQYSWANRTANPSVGGLVFAQFPGDNAPPGHVGFYIGNGNVMSARDPALGTGIDSLSSWGGHIVGYGDEPNATGLIGQVVGALGSFVSATVGGIEGLLSGDGSKLAGAVAGIGRFIGGGMSHLVSLAQRGARFLFDAAWDHTIGPLIGQVPAGNLEGSAVRYAGDVIKKGVDKFLGDRDSAAQAQVAAAGAGGTNIGPVSGPADAGPAQAMMYALGKMGAFGWSQGQFTPLRSLWNQESGWNRFARNPSSGAYGIPQSLPPTKLPLAGQAGGGSHASPQIDWGLSYIKGTPGYGSPAAAWAHEQAHNWYATGGVAGEVPVPYLAGFSAGQAHDILVAAGLRPSAPHGQRATWWATGAHPRAASHVPPHSVVEILASASSSREQTRVPYLAGYTAGQAHNILVAEGLVPVAAHGQRATWLVTGSRPGGGAAARRGMHVEIIAPQPRTPGPITAPPGGRDAAQNWNFYSSQLPALAAVQKARFWSLYNAKMPRTITAGQLASWRRDQKALFGAQSAMASTRDTLLHALGHPDAQSASTWQRLQTQLGKVRDLESGKSDPAWNWPAWHYQHGAWQAANAATAAMQADVGHAYAAWKSLYGGGGPRPLYGTPGVLVTPHGGSPAPVNLAPLVGGLPGAGAVVTGPSASTTGMGFAAGGRVGSDGASLGQVASMFALGGQVPEPALGLLGLAPAAQAQLSALAAQQAPRTLSQAAGGDRVGVKVGNLTIHNPVAERPSDTLARSTNRLAFLAGRGS